MPSKFYFLPLFLELLYVTKKDWETKTIANIWSLIHLFYFMFLFLNPPTSPFYSLSWSHFAIPLQVFFLSFLLFLLKIMGAGDGKYLSSLLLLLPVIPHPHQNFQILFLGNLGKSIIVGFSFYLFLPILKKNRPFSFSFASIYQITQEIKESLSFSPKKKIPFAPFIFMAFILSFFSKSFHN